MIVASNGNKFGCTPFFPGKLSNGRPVRMANFATVRRLAGPQTAFHLIMIVVGFLNIDNDEFISKWIFVILLYAIVRAMRKRKVVIDVKKTTTCSLAPPLVWADHFSCFAMLFFGILVTNGYLATPFSAEGMLAMLGLSLVTLVGIAPIWSFYVYLKEIKSKNY